MAESPAHRFEQLIGELLESVVRPQLENFCQNQGYGNAHDLDFVIEQEGTDHQIGKPVAFKSAWRKTLAK